MTITEDDLKTVQHLVCDSSGKTFCPHCHCVCWHIAGKWGGCKHAVAAGTMDGKSSVVIRCE